MKRIYMLLIGFVIMLSVFPTCVGAEEAVAENNSYVMYADVNTGNLCIKDKSTGYIWRSNPEDAQQDSIAQTGNNMEKLTSQIIISYSKGFSEISASSSAQSVAAGGLSYEKIENGIQFTYSFPELGFVVPVRYTLGADSMRAEIVMSGLVHKITKKENVDVGGYMSVNVDVDYNITSIQLLPFFGAGYFEETGYCFVPDGCGALINFGKGKEPYGVYSAPIYGSYKDTKMYYGITDTARLPVFGIKREDNAFLGVVDENEAAAMVGVIPAGLESSYTNCYTILRCKILETGAGISDTQPMTPLIPDESKDYGVTYYFLQGEQANYSGMAAKYRQILIENKNMPKIGENVADGSFYVKVYGGVKKEKSIMGIPRTVLEPLTTFDDIRKINERLTDSGISQIVYQYINWQPLGQMGKIMKKTSFDSKLGSKNDFKKLSEELSYSNAAIYLDADFVNYAKGGNGVNRFGDAVKAPDQSPAFMTQTKNPKLNIGKRWYLLDGSSAVRVFGRFFESFEKINGEQISLSSVSNYVYANNASSGTKRGVLPEKWTELMSMAGGRVMSEEANAYAFPKSAHIVAAPDSSSGNLLFDEEIPFYQMSIHGAVAYSSPAFNNSGDISNSFLKAVEYGAAPMYVWIGQDSSKVKDTDLNYIYSAGFEDWLDIAAEQYRRFKPLYDRVKESAIKEHACLSDGVYHTVYENGTEVIVNYSDEDYVGDGFTVGTMDFVVR